MSNRLGGLQGTAYVGTNANQPPNWQFSKRNPNQYDTNHSIGDLWLNTLTYAVYVLVSLQGSPTSKGSLALWQPFCFTDRVGFSADITQSINNVTGAGVFYYIPFDRTYYNSLNSFDVSNGIYTAPYNGIYQFNLGVTMQGITAAMTVIITGVQVSGTGPCVGEWSFFRGNPYSIIDGATGLLRVGGSVSVQLFAGDQVRGFVQIQGGALDSARVSYGAVPLTTTPARTWFNGVFLGPLT